jgi:prepilin-type N-terminal cleavage/methylation domain-containing protein
MFVFPQRFRDQAGLTLVEMMVVLVIMVVIAAMAIMQRGSVNELFRRQGVARELKVAFERARFDSVKRRTTCANRAKVVVNASSFTLWTDKNMNGTPEDAEKVVTNLPTGIVIAGATFPFTVSFDMRGEIQSVVPPALRVCNISCSSPNNTNSNLLLVTPTGTVNLLPGSATAPVFGSPGSEVVSTSTDINDSLLNPAGAPALCAP